MNIGTVNEEQSVTPLVPDRDGWQSTWEDRIYGQGRHLNLYPHHSVVSYLFRAWPRRGDRHGIRILEMGCGAGNNLWFAAREGFQVAGIEGSTSAVTFANQRFQAEGLTGDIRAGDFQDLPWDDGSFDMVLDRQSILCNTRVVIENAFDEIVRVLRPGGRFFSMMYSDRHPERINGMALGDNSYDNFERGYFKDCGIVHFSPREEIDMLYGSRFRIESIIHVGESDWTTNREEGNAVNGYWRIDCRRRG